MSDERADAFDQALRVLEAGQDPEAVLALYPELAGELRALLQTAQAAGAGQPPVPAPRAGQAASRARLLAQAAEKRAGMRRRAPGLLAVWPALARTALITAVFLAGFAAGTYGAVAASAQSLPGDALYGVKRAAEQAQLLLATDPVSKARLEAEFSERRVDEVEAVTASGRVAPVEFTGRIEAMTGERWVVAGIPVLVPPQAQVTGEAARGRLARVKGAAQSDGSVLAEEVTIEAFAENETPAPTATPTITQTQTPRPTATQTAQLTATPAPPTPPESP